MNTGDCVTKLPSSLRVDVYCHSLYYKIDTSVIGFILYLFILTNYKENANIPMKFAEIK